MARVANGSGENAAAIGIGGVDDGKFVDVAAIEIEKDRRLLAQRAADISVELCGVVGWFDSGEWIGRVEGGIVTVSEELSMKFVGAGLGEDFDAAVAELVVFGGERVLVDANLADRRLRRELAGGESVDIHLAAVRSGGGSGKRFEIGL